MSACGEAETLLHGEPGCEKSEIAAEIATKLKMGLRLCRGNGSRSTGSNFRTGVGEGSAICPSAWRTPASGAALDGKCVSKLLFTVHEILPFH
jgi:hypothetical protein